MQQKNFDLSSLNGANGFSVPGLTENGDGLGYSVSTAGDVNGDGISDLVLAAPYVNLTTGGIYVIFGSRAGFAASFNLANLNGSNGFTVPGIGASYLGISVSTAGDINGDGIDDLVLGAPAGDGRSYVIFGTRVGFGSIFNLNNLNGTNGFTVPGVASGGRLGYSVGTAGDINGDNITDLVLGAYLANSNAGISYVIFGTRTGFGSIFNLTNLNGTNGFIVPGIEQNGVLGVSVSAAGDLNGDGIGDLVLGASNANSYAGVSYVIFGSRAGFGSSFNLTSLNGTNGFAVPGMPLAHNLGASFSKAGDINGDGIDDLVLGEPAATGSGTGTSYVIFGNRVGFTPFFNLSNLNGSNGFTVPGLAIGDKLGYSVSAAGDTNGDGLSDLVLGAFGVNNNTGASYVIFGSREGFASSFNLTSLNGTNGFTVPGVLAGGGYLGYSVSTAGDVNGDGVSDLVLGAYQANSYAGISYVIFGQFPLLLVSNQMVITQGQVLILTNAQFNATDAYGPSATLVFTITNLQGGRFERISNLGVPIMTFTQQEINTAQIRFVSDRSAVVAYDVSVGNGRLSTRPVPANITFTNHPPIVLAAPLTQVVEVNKPFSFTFKAGQIFNDTDGDPLAFFAESSGGLPLPSWIQFDNNQTNQLAFRGTPPSLGGSRFSLFAQDPLNATVHTDFDVIAVPTGSVNTPGSNTTVVTTDSTTQIAVSVGTIGGFGLLVGLGLGFWRCTANKNSRTGEQFADLIRVNLNLKDVNNFDSTMGKKYVLFVYALQDNLKKAGIDINTLNAGELDSLVDDIGDAARNKISPARDCLGRSVITVGDLNNKLQELVTEIQMLRNSGAKQSDYTV